MDDLLAPTIAFFKAGLLIWLALLGSLIAIRMLRGDIRVDGLLTHARDSEGNVDVERVVNMVVFPIVIVMYVAEALSMKLAAGAPPMLPDVPDYLLSLLVGGNGLYLAGKIMRAK